MVSDTQAGTEPANAPPSHPAGATAANSPRQAPQTDNHDMAGAELDWTYVIRPRTGWFELHLSELWRYRDLTALFAWRDFVATYKQTILGPIWYIVQPLFTCCFSR